MAKQPLSKALNAVAQQTGAEISFDPAAVKGLTAPELKGDLTLDQALERLLDGTKLKFRRTDKGVYLVFPSAGTATEADAEPALIEGLPEILVSGKRAWSMNTGIARTEDDTQPFIIFDQAQIQRSGATTLEDFFRQELTADNSASTSDQSRRTGQGLTSVNLRGLGANKTLILIDGRRFAGANNVFDAGAGTVGQTQINGIPLDSIERIEVLASSASGIYGSNAAGGVINIVLRRDYKGLQATLSKGATLDGGGGTRRLDVSGSNSFEDGRTRLSYFGSMSESDPLRLGQRDLLQRGRQRLLDSDPNYYTTGAGAGGPIPGATPNIRSVNGSNLTLKNGTPLNSPITYLPDGYTSANGTAPLVTNAGKYNLGLAPNAAGQGANAPLLLGQKNRSGTIAVKREFTDWLNVYGQVSSSVSDTSSPSSRVADTFTLAASALNNPFNQAIQISAPAIGADKENLSRTTNTAAVFGATVRLAHGWRAILDASKNWTRYSTGATEGPIDLATTLGILKGTTDIFKDARQSPIAYGYLDPSIGTSVSPSKSTGSNLAFRLAGPIPVDLPGGKPVATFLVEKNRIWLGGVTQFNNGTPPVAPTSLSANVGNLTLQSLSGNYNIAYLPQRSRDTKSIYGEIRLPIIGEKNEIPLVKSLEVEIAGRQDRYHETADVQLNPNGIPLTNITCASSSTRFLQPADLSIQCPAADTPFVTSLSKRKTFNPTLSMRWQLQDDVALRASYATGFVPPQLNQMQRSPPNVIQSQAYAALFGINYLKIKDPLRGNEVLGSNTPTITYTMGGNPDVKPETSKTSSAGIILTPRFIPSLRLSVDWTHIVQKDNYFSPGTLITSTGSPALQAMFAAYLQAHPERFTRGPASGGFSVGPITNIDASIGNILGSKMDAIDLAASYQLVFQGSGTLDLTANATYLKSLTVEAAPGSLTKMAGVASGDFTLGSGATGGVKWKSNLAATWSTSNWSLGSRVRFVGSYYLDPDHSYILPGQGSSTIPKQIYVDLYGSYKLPYDTELRVTANNAFNRAPPFDAASGGAYYSRFGDPRMAYYTVGLNKKF